MAEEVRESGELDGDSPLRLWNDDEIQSEERRAIDRRREHVGRPADGKKIERNELSRRDPNDPSRKALSDEVANGVLLPGYAGLAFSGGGIRSATFALGIAQALARANLLKYFDYLSTVSGGGYTGGSFTWLLRRRDDAEEGAPPKYDLDAERFPFGTAPPRDRQDDRNRRGMLRYLRERGNYLIPGRGITVLSGVAVVLRGILLNLIVWFPIATAIFLLTLRYAEISLQVAAGIATMFVGICILYSLATFLSRRHAPRWWSRYAGRRFFESRVKTLIPLAIAFAVFGSMPLLVYEIDKWAAASGGLSLIAGIFGALSKFAGGDKKNGGPGTGFVAPLAALLFLYGFAALACSTAMNIAGALGDPVLDIRYFYGVVLGSLLTAVFVNSNYISVHRFYRDRLMEAFMPDDASIEKNRTGPARGADTARMSGIWNRGGTDDSGGPYHIVNTNLVLVDSGNRKFRIRGGDNFILSPLFCGGSATRYLPTDRFMSDGMTLPTAVAISGAAANPDAGVGGTGATRNRAVSWILALFNIRLGYWVPNPLRVVGGDDGSGRVLPTATYGTPPNHVTTFLYEVCLGGFKRKRKWLQISDGGHFENLALYELVRRRLRLIVVSDAGADPNFGFGDLRNAVLRIAEDFGAKVDISRNFWAGEGKPERLSRLIPDENLPAGFPSKVALAERGYLIGTIDYGPRSDSDPTRDYGILILLKTTMVDGLSLETRGYRGDHPDFPDQTTADQFFDDQQFEAYRELGYVIGSAMIEGARLKDLIATVR